VFQQESAFGMAIWRPVELFGPGIELRLDPTIWPYATLAGAILLSEQISRGLRRNELLYGALILATLMAANMLTVVLLWAALPVARGLRSISNGVSELRGRVPDFVAIIPLMAAAPLINSDLSEPSMGSATTLMMISAAGLLRAWSGDRESGLLQILPGLALVARFGALSEPSVSVAILGAVSVLSGLTRRRRNELLAVFGLAVFTLGLAGMQAQTILLTALVTLVLVNQSDQVGRSWSQAGVWAAGAAIASFASVAGAVGLALPTGIAIMISAGLIAASRWRGKSSGTEYGSGSIADWAAALLPILVIGTVSVSAELKLTSLGVFYAIGGIVLGIAIARAPIGTGWQTRLINRWRTILASATAAVHLVLRGGAAGVRTITGLFEGESGVIWMFLLLLMAVIGMQA
jgi:hypothetical protein